MDDRKTVEEQPADESQNLASQTGEKRRPWSAPTLAMIEVSRTENGGSGSSTDAKGGDYIS